MSLRIYQKDPAAIRNFTIDLSGDLLATQTLAITGTPTGGTFTINEVTSGLSTSAIARNASALAVQAALRAILGAGVTCIGGALPSNPVTIVLDETLAGTVAFTTTDSFTGGSSPASSITPVTLSSIDWTVPAGITEAASSNTNTTATIKVSGGTDGEDYEAVLHYVMSNGEEDEVSILIQVRHAEGRLSVVTTVSGATANSYVTRAEAESYLARRLNNANWNSADDDTKDQALITATKRIDQESFQGYRVESTQALKWPRSVVQIPGEYGYYATDAIPQPIKDAVCEYALELLSTDSLSESGLNNFKELTVGPISMVMNGPVSSGKLPDQVSRLLRGLVMSSGAQIVRA